MTTSNTNAAAAELLSALVDGEPQGHELDLALAAFENDDEMRIRWSCYHVIGDLLRSPYETPLIADSGFHQRFSQRLALQSGYILKSRAAASGSHALAEPPLGAVPRQPAANDPSFSWKLVAGFTSLAAISAVVWGVFYAAAPISRELASGQSAEQVLIATPQGAMVRDARLNEWMEAHRQAGALPTQMPSGFLRSATFETPPGSSGR